MVVVDGAQHVVGQREVGNVGVGMRAAKWHGEETGGASITPAASAAQRQRRRNPASAAPTAANTTSASSSTALVRAEFRGTPLSAGIFTLFRYSRVPARNGMNRLPTMVKVRMMNSGWSMKANGSGTSGDEEQRQRDTACCAPW